ncbi:porphobilinogen synthase [Acinetobacter qingfengensis]|uniref:Delta-aminolevulinic acid dehydratase n=1 Tax=Acinetobacter qingfengensis TaxID=1262585 RepID=A0A1E7REP4_9GAMM|nr:porphobilinogen synthase [Acinetobacter qingfengensis]KAA8735043.1 porphobilinogen synthase [Acinetobacter qingfengensis]OEY97766.1 delta-aminolevulinic acid dehydratase [Acinetobacter qingfengensis]
MLNLRRLRTNANIRNLVKENTICLDELIYPLFIEENIAQKQEISTLPGLYRFTEADIEQEIKTLYQLGIKTVMPFGISHHKDEIGSDTWQDEGLLSRMIKAIKSACPEMIVIPDICFCEYTSHGHCGVMCGDTVDNEPTLENLAKQSVAAAKAGADMLAPSAMMDGQIAAIRQALDKAGYAHVSILAHAIKFSSAFYGPFRVAVDTQLKGDRKTYQADFHNGRQAMIEAELDEMEGADILMVKPGTPYLDVLARLRDRTDRPLAAYQVGGEYAGIKFAALAGAMDEPKTVYETLIGFKRAGANMIVTYHAKQFAEWIKAGKIEI